jgi:hypothetical protein
MALMDQGGPQEMACLPLEYVNGWLFSINASRVKAEIRERLARYQRECYRVLAEAFINRLGQPDEQEQSADLLELSKIREMGLAIASMAEQQMTLTARVNKAPIVVSEHGQRITAL